MTTRTTAAAAALALLLAPALAACGGSGGGLDALARHGAAGSAPTSTDDPGFSDHPATPDQGTSSPTSAPTDGSAGGGCATLLTDLEGIEGDLTGATGPSDLAAKVKTLEAKLTADAASGSAALQTAVKNYNTLLTRIVKDATGHDTTALSADERNLTSVATQLGEACE